MYRIYFVCSKKLLPVILSLPAIGEQFYQVGSICILRQEPSSLFDHLSWCHVSYLRTEVWVPVCSLPQIWWTFLGMRQTCCSPFCYFKPLVLPGHGEHLYCHQRLSLGHQGSSVVQRPCHRWSLLNGQAQRHSDSQLDVFLDICNQFRKLPSRVDRDHGRPKWMVQASILS